MPRFGIAVLTLATMTALGVFLSFWWVGNEHARELRVWQDRLGIIADSRAAAVADWLRGRLETIAALGDDQAVQLYAADLRAAPSAVARPGDDDPLAQRQYLDNLLTVTAGRAGFAGRADGPQVAANVPRTGRAGIAILDLNLQPVATSPGMPPFDSALRGFVASRLGQEDAALFGPFAGAADGTPSMAFAAPLGDIGGGPPVGIVVGVRPVANELFELLRQPGATQASAEAMLVAARDAAVLYLSPLADGTPALGRALALDTPGLAAAWALRHPGGFAEKRDYRDVPVLATSRTVSGTGWVLAYKIDRDEALGGADARLTRMLIGLLLLVAAIAAAIVAVWRHGASRRASEAAQRFRDMAERYEQQSKFIRRLTDSQPNGIFIAARDGRVLFANRHIAEAIGAETADSLVGKGLAAIFGPAEARRYAAGIRDAIENDHTVTVIDRVELTPEVIAAGGEVQVLRTEYVPLPETPYAPAGVLAVEQDISDAILLRERNERLLQQLVDTLLGVVDRRDPWAAGQSARVATVAQAIAREMDLEPVLVDTVAKAASLMNLGKIMVPRALLVKVDRLTDAEIGEVREALGAGAGLIEGIEFDGPVVETLRQVRERFDGNGEPRRLAGDRILVTARIVAVANAFVGMVSPRAHRVGLEFDIAVDLLFEECGGAFDRAVVVALVNHLDNRNGRTAWAGFAHPPGDAAAPE